MKSFVIAAVIILILPFFVSSTAAVKETVIYVSPTGNDDNPGTISKPLASLEGARDLIRKLREQETEETAYTVLIAGGDYRISDTFVLDSRDSGTVDAPVIYRNMPGETVNLVGGQIIPGTAFRKVTDNSILERLPNESAGKVLQVSLKSYGITDYGRIMPWGFGIFMPAPLPDLFVDGEVMTLARWPNEGWAVLEKVIDRGSVWGSNVPGEPELREKPDRGGIFELKDSRIRSWVTAEDAWLYGYWWWDWADSAVQIDRVDPEKQQIKTVQPHYFGYRTGGKYYAFNLLEEIDSPGEWYLNRTSGILYLYPPKPLSDARIEISQLENPMIQLNDVSHVMFQGLVLETMRGTSIEITGGTGCTIAACTIRNTSGQAVRISGGNSHLVTGCDIYNTNGGISLKGGDRKSLSAGGHSAVNNIIRDWARISRTYNPAVYLSGVGQTASHNRIYNAPHAAIMFDGNDHLIEFNDISDVCSGSNDAGVIYAGRNWSMRGNNIRYNYIHDVSGSDGQGATGIYLDDGFSGTGVYGNILYNIRGTAFLIGGGRDNIIENNISVSCGPLSIDDRLLNWAFRSAAAGGDMRQTLDEMPYRKAPWSSRYPELFNILSDQPAVPKGNAVRNNIFVNSSEMKIADMVSRYGIIENNWSTADDPGFTDKTGRNFSIEEDAVLFEMVPGFREIPFSQIGLQHDEFRTVLPPKAPVIVFEGRVFLNTAEISLLTQTADAVIHYTLDGSLPTKDSPEYTGPVLLTETCTLRAAAVSSDNILSKVTTADFIRYDISTGQGIPLNTFDWLRASGYCDPGYDRNFNGDPIILGNEKYEQGLFMHPAETAEGNRAVTEYLFPQGFDGLKRFRAVIGVDGAVGQRGSVRFIVEISSGDPEEYKRVFTSNVIRGGENPVEINVDINGAVRLRLIVTDGGDDIHSDHAVWADARFE